MNMEVAQPSAGLLRAYRPQRQNSSMPQMRRHPTDFSQSTYSRHPRNPSETDLAVIKHRLTFTIAIAGLAVTFQPRFTENRVCRFGLTARRHQSRPGAISRSGSPRYPPRAEPPSRLRHRHSRLRRHVARPHGGAGGDRPAAAAFYADRAGRPLYEERPCALSRLQVLSGAGQHAVTGSKRCSARLTRRALRQRT